MIKITSSIMASPFETVLSLGKEQHDAAEKVASQQLAIDIKSQIYIVLQQSATTYYEEHIKPEIDKLDTLKKDKNLIDNNLANAQFLLREIRKKELANVDVDEKDKPSANVDVDEKDKVHEKAANAKEKLTMLAELGIQLESKVFSNHRVIIMDKLIAMVFSQDKNDIIYKVAIQKLNMLTELSIQLESKVFSNHRVTIMDKLIAMVFSIDKAIEKPAASEPIIAKLTLLDFAESEIERRQYSPHKKHRLNVLSLIKWLKI